MIVACSKCTTRLQIDDAKVPSRAFTVRCPKCQTLIQAQPANGSNGQQSALGVGETPALQNPRFNAQMAAPLVKRDEDSGEDDTQAYSSAAPVELADLARVIVELLQQASPVAASPRAGTRLKWEHRRVLVCVAPPRREEIGRALVNENYQVYLAENTSQAIERMREDKMDVVILEADFDAVEQGAAFVTSEINALRPNERRRLIFAQLSPTVRTLDSHAAFVQNVNVVINTADMELLPNALERTFRDYNDLYREFNGALNIAAL
ncbi:MAG: hypothetical protein QOJ64_1977 [Acidobacteriota bacterium]|jgi:predicted Zn finger-like uncharacterized protein|nr:hypothetical protein [Acidobacteriota bacterium]